ncbi:uncharacterized protein Tco025E_05547 [Trypanosoma conorhini]|uniref:LisH domain-containing protein n=1 Tax=Trypanosoma conorhini TaxID=83891 RepID=A0A3R7KXD2_9TRYP|nr:uncharacterized protein Tco025E_05547 [Trypanosoma conorhini]RNF15324.1 hypothetical protein Tco025E_05547 [Trypanosoma conorhini]
MIPSASRRGAGDAAAPLSTSAGAAASPAAPFAFAPNELDALSVSELRAGMQQFLRSSGALGSLKTQLRSVIVSELLKRQGPSPKASAARQGREGGGDDCGSEEVEDDAWTQRLADALVESHLRHTGRSFSLAIFSSEADVSFGSGGDDALAGLLHLNTSVTLRRRTSLLHSVLEAYLRQVGDARGMPPGYTVGTQTDISETELSPPPLEVRLAAVDAKYALSFSRLRESTREEVDRRMLAYREELQVQMEQGYQQRLRTFEQQQLHEARRAAEEHYGILLQHKMEEMREMERAGVQRIEAERARLGQARDEVELQRVELERRHRDLQGLLEERDKAVVAVEGRLRDAKQQIRVLTTQVQQYEELCGVRLAEADAARDREWRRVEDLRRLQAEHLAELQLKDEEIGRLRFRLKSILAAHGVGNWRDEVGGAGEEERAVSLREGLAKANAFQERVSAAADAPLQRNRQLRDAAWLSAWQSTAPPERGEARNADGRSYPAELQVVLQPARSVVQSSQEQKRQPQPQPQEEEGKVKEPRASSPPPATALVATDAAGPCPVTEAAESFSTRPALAAVEVSPRALEGNKLEGEERRKDVGGGGGGGERGSSASIQSGREGGDGCKGKITSVGVGVGVVAVPGQQQANRRLHCLREVGAPLTVTLLPVCAFLLFEVGAGGQTNVHPQHHLLNPSAKGGARRSSER